MLQSEGIIQVDVERQRVVVNITYDFVQYYQWFLRREYWLHVDAPLFGSHITLASRKHHSDVNWAWAFKQYNNKHIKFEYSEDIYIGGRLKGFVMFYIKVFSSEIDEIKKDIGAIENSTFRGNHITIGNRGKSGAKIRPWWPELISLKH